MKIAFKPMVRAPLVGIALVVLIALGLILGGSQLRAQSEETATDPLSLTVSLKGSSNVSLGEPITLHYTISNISDQKVGVRWGEEEWYSLTLTDEAGKTNVFAASKPKSLQAGFRVMPDPFIAPGHLIKNFLTVTQRLAISHPGNYTLTVHVLLPYTLVETSEENPVKVEKQITSENNVFNQDYTFRLSVAPADDLVLRTRANSLVQAMFTDHFGPAFQADMEALFSMPETQAAPSWKSLVNDASRANAELIASQLARLHSITTADLLVQMLDNPKLSSDEASFIRTKIDESYNAGDVTVKGHIKALAASRGGTMPEKVAIPQPSD
jgi:hypothetical protein